jgi:membrane protein implicated in regulation of membrane protease activity
MALIVGALLAFFFLEPPWRYLVLIPLALWEIFEISLFLKWRRVRAKTGVEGLVGARGRAISECRPDGQVRVQGQIWGAHCQEGAKVGDDVVVESVDGLRLTVNRLDRSSRV